MRNPLRMACVTLAVLVLAYALERYPAIRTFRVLEGGGQLYNWSGPSFFPEHFRRFVPFSRPKTIVVNQAPPNTGQYVSALKEFGRADEILHFAPDLPSEVYEALGSLRDVRTLVLHYLPSDHSFQCFNQVDSVESLCIVDSFVSDASLSHLEKFRNVTELEVWLTGVTPKVADVVGRLPKLKEFRYARDGGGHFGPRVDSDEAQKLRLQKARPGLVIDWE